MTRSLVLAGNFNLTNIDELYERLIDLGQYPPAKTDTVTILERIGHFLDRENEDKYRYFKDKAIPNARSPTCWRATSTSWKSCHWPHAAGTAAM